MEAVRDAGIDKKDVEAVIAVAPQAQPRLSFARDCICAKSITAQ
jgi:hypothetical protein